MTRGSAAARRQWRVACPAVTDDRRSGFAMDSGRRFAGCNEAALNAAVFPDSLKQALAVSIDRR
ncbi:hypothetical protein L810_5827 [Burkholderia sp. AU4i]|nr:hypothetical protein L810_5827 [Burkholderia sp. AU4i]